MNIVTILGSPKKNGNTSIALQYFEKASAGKGHSVERINLVDHTIHPCRECYACTEIHSSFGCVQKDDLNSLFEKLYNADEIIYASPLIGWDYSSLLKLFMDRHFSLIKGFKTPEHESFLEDKNVNLLITCMGPEAGNADLVQELFERFGDSVKADNIRKYIATNSNSPDYPQQAMAIAEKMLDDMRG